MKNWFIVFAVFSVQFFFSQESKLDLKIKDKIEYLKKNGADTIVVYSQNCVGCYPKIITIGECVSDETKFIFWTRNENYFMQKMDECFEYVEQKIENSKFLKIVVENPKKIEKAKILPVAHNSDKKDSKSREIMIEYVVDHFSYYDFEFYFKNKKINKKIIDYKLETKMIDEKTPNDNYASNQKSILKKLLDLVKLEIY